jgi:DNA-binding CsgD family transcriptional regulator
LHRRTADFSATDVALMELLRPPITAALVYRTRVEAAMTRLRRMTGGDPIAPFGAERAALTDRELEVLALVASGRTDRQIGRCLGITERTVRKHEEDIRQRLAVPNRAAAAAWSERTQKSRSVP